MGRAPCCDKANVKKGPWSPEEDSQLKHYIQTYGTASNWVSLPQRAGLRRCGKSCRLRWLNYLRPNIKHGQFSPEEDALICSLYATIGTKWSVIAAQLPGRTDNDIKNYWNTKLKKKLMGIASSSTNNTNSNIPQIIKKTQSLSPISHQNASFNQPLISNNINVVNPIAHEPLSYSPSTNSSIPMINCDNTIVNGYVVNNPFDQCFYETRNQIQIMGFEEINHDEQVVINNMNNNGNAVIMDYGGGMLNMEEEKKMIIKKEMEEKYCCYYY